MLDQLKKCKYILHPDVNMSVSQCQTKVSVCVLSVRQSHLQERSSGCSCAGGVRRHNQQHGYFYTPECWLCCEWFNKQGKLTLLGSRRYTGKVSHIEQALVKVEGGLHYSLDWLTVISGHLVFQRRWGPGIVRLEPLCTLNLCGSRSDNNHTTCGWPSYIFNGECVWERVLESECAMFLWAAHISNKTFLKNVWEVSTYTSL